MAQPYLNDLKIVVKKSLPPLSESRTITCKHFFSGAAAYHKDNIFMSLSPVGLALKLPENDCDALFTEGAKPLQYFSKAPVKKGYAVLPATITDDEKTLAEWIRRALDFARTEQSS